MEQNQNHVVEDVQHEVTEDTLEERIARLEAEVEQKTKEALENWDKLLRERADLENFRKRVSREKEEILSYGVASFVEEILPVVDNLERALLHVSDDEKSPLLEGIRMTHGMLLNALKKVGATPVEACQGTLFDPCFHQAMNQVETEEQEPNTVVHELQKGYLLKERLLRPAMVSVAKKP